MSLNIATYQTEANQRNAEALKRQNEYIAMNNATQKSETAWANGWKTENINFLNQMLRDKVIDQATYNAEARSINEQHAAYIKDINATQAQRNKEAQDEYKAVVLDSANYVKEMQAMIAAEQKKVKDQFELQKKLSAEAQKTALADLSFEKALYTTADYNKKVSDINADYARINDAINTAYTTIQQASPERREEYLRGGIGSLSAAQELLARSKKPPAQELPAGITETVRVPEAPSAPIITKTASAPTISTPVSTPAPKAPEVDYYSFFRGIPGPSEATPSAPIISGPAVRNPIIEYFANTPIASPFPTLPYRFQTLTPENVNLRQGLGTLPTSTPLIQAPPAPQAQFATPTTTPTTTAATPFPATPFGLNIPATQYIGPAPTVAQLQAALAAQQAQANAPVGESTAPVTAPTTAPVAGRMGGMVGFAEGGMPKLTPAEAGSQVNVQDYIDPKTGKFYINEYKRDVVFNPILKRAEDLERAKMVRFEEGGIASLAEGLADKGRGGDTMLVHMAPEEVAGLQSLAQQYGTSLTINPETGLPEALKLKSIFKAVAPALPFLIPGLGTAIAGLGAKAGLGAIASKAVAAGIIGGLTAKGGGFNFKEGLKTGLTAFAGAKAFEALNAASATQTDLGSGVKTSSAGKSIDVFKPEAVAADVTQAATVQAPPSASLSPPPAVGPSQYQLLPGAAPDAASLGSLKASAAPISEVGSSLSQVAAKPPGMFERTFGITPSTAITGAYVGTSLVAAQEAKEEQEKYEQEQRRLEEEEDRRRKQYSDLFSRTLGQVPTAAGGGIVALSKGGEPTFEYGGTTAKTGEPRMVRGAGDGMSDNVPATIEGVQEARLANDEFVVPADVVADIGNGSSNAGAKKLYAMMDRVRKARHGTVKQPPEIRAERFMPA